MYQGMGTKRGTSEGECYGTYNSSTGIGSGAGYTNACIHSGSNTGSGGNTVWYNYGTATAGTITGTDNTIIATESICPKNWSLPSKVQTLSIGDGSTTYISSFSPVLGGHYYNGGNSSVASNGNWWSSTTYNGAQRYLMYYDGSILNTLTSGRYRHDGSYIRCVSEEKDVSDLTYMQDMTAKVAADTPEGMTASLTDRRDGKVYTVAKINGNMWMTE
ncbi:hypothetical protein IKF84_00250, partial [Candidatus Saccharibacteria bacterium]|nr:hypothetical protein [Candidatus Saccharibacteria bacterium]